MLGLSLFQNIGRPLTIHGITLRNRIIMSPMCQYSELRTWKVWRYQIV